MYLDLGLPPNRLQRQMYCGLEAVRKHTKQHGHTWTPISTFAAGIHGGVSGAEIRPDKALQLALRCKRPFLAIRRDCQSCGGKRSSITGEICGDCGGSGGGLWVAEAHKARAERVIANHVSYALSREASDWPIVDRDTFPRLSDHQLEQLTFALQGRLAILTGYPGTGKTWTVAELVKVLIKAFGAGCVAIAAPTGKAAVRCTEVMNSKEIAITARTIHRMLRVVSLEDGEFEFNESNPLPYRFVIFDEASMIDVPLMAAIMRARGKGTHYLFVGDPNQLPPVGHGAPLRDLLASEVPRGRLVNIERNSGTIVHTCKAVCEGDRFSFDHTLDLGAGKNLRLIPASHGIAQSRLIDVMRMIRDTRPYLLDPIWDCQIIVAVNDKSPLSRKSLNKLLQNELNPNGRAINKSPFRVGDKVVQLSNAYFPLYDPDRGEVISDPLWTPGYDELETNSKGQVLVCNGEFGRVLDVHEKKTIVKFSAPDRIVLIPRGSGSGDGSGDVDEQADTGCDMDLAYAATCHKMQGSEIRCAIVVLDEYPGATGSRGICTREWFTTGITRGREMSICIGRESTAENMIRRTALPLRKTFLRELIGFELRKLRADGGQGTCHRKLQNV
jgi:ATP-dependent exoDNAse (exonuclease V) alpha subunit